MWALISPLSICHNSMSGLCHRIMFHLSLFTGCIIVAAFQRDTVSVEGWYIWFPKPSTRSMKVFGRQACHGLAGHMVRANKLLIDIKKKLNYPAYSSFVWSKHRHWCSWRSSRESDTPRHCWSWMYHTAHWDRVYLNIPDFVNQITCWSVIHIYFMWQLCHHHRPISSITQWIMSDLFSHLPCYVVFKKLLFFSFLWKTILRHFLSKNKSKDSEAMLIPSKN